MATPAIEVQNLTKNYGPVLAVDDVSFQVQPGELVGFLGPNGAGKSTCMRILTTWLPASRGFARVAGFDVMYQSMDVRQRVGYLPESVPLYTEMRVREYLAYRAKLKGVPREGRTARLDYCIVKCRIKGVENRLLGTLSKGYRQRVGLADAMLADPPILILDEPTSGLDPVQINETLNTIKELGGKHTVLLSTHILTEVEKVCERVIIIDKGKLKLDKTMKEIESSEPAYALEVRGPNAAVGSWLREQPELLSVEQQKADGEYAEFEVRGKGGLDPREVLASKVLAKGWGLRKLELRRASLETLFNDVVLRRPPAPATEPAPAEPPTEAPGATPDAAPPATAG